MHLFNFLGFDKVLKQLRKRASAKLFIHRAAVYAQPHLNLWSWKLKMNICYFKGTIFFLFFLLVLGNNQPKSKTGWLYVHPVNPKETSWISDLLYLNFNLFTNPHESLKERRCWNTDVIKSKCLNKHIEQLDLLSLYLNLFQLCEHFL